MEQKTALVHEAKTVLDSWVRYEGQVKQRQQRELAESVISKIKKELENPKTLQQILQQSVADVESKLSTSPYIGALWLTRNCRDCSFEITIKEGLSPTYITLPSGRRELRQSDNTSVFPIMSRLYVKSILSLGITISEKFL